MDKQSVTSREYKLMLKADLFSGDEPKLLSVANQCWSCFRGFIRPSVISLEGSLDEIDKRRTINFYDTDTHRLRRNDYVFRERTDVDSNKREVTLKFRHPDRYITQDRDMDAKKARAGKTKFEEDIKPAFLKLYSYSTKQKISASKNLNKMNDPVDLFPGLESALDHYEAEEAIDVVGKFTARELVITGGSFQIRESPAVQSECALIVWYNNDGDPQKPKLVEFSFQYGSKQENYSGAMARRAYDVFRALQELKPWVDSESMTKTAYVYSLAECRRQ